MIGSLRREIDPRAQHARLQLLAERLLRLAPVAERQYMRLVQMSHRAVRGQHRGDLAKAAQHPCGAECLIEPVQMRHAVQQRQHLRRGAHGRRNGRDRIIQIVGLAAEQNDIIVARDHIGGDRVNRPGDVPERTLDDEAGLG